MLPMTSAQIAHRVTALCERLAASDEALSPAMTPIEALVTRRSLGAKYLGLPRPSEQDLLLMTLAALRSPDHGELVPFRFSCVEPYAARALGKLFREAAVRRGKDESAASAEEAKAHEPPLTIAVIARLRNNTAVPEHEQWMAVGGAIGNFVAAAHALGYGAKMLSGASTTDQAVISAFCQSGESLVGWIVLGTPKARHPRRPKSVHPFSVMSLWTPPSQ